MLFTKQLFFGVNFIQYFYSIGCHVRLFSLKIWKDSLLDFHLLQEIFMLMDINLRTIKNEYKIR